MKTLLIIDLQKQFKDDNGRYEKCLKYIKEHRGEYDHIVATYFRNGLNLNFKKKLGWTGCLDASSMDLEFDLTGVEVYTKYGYGFKEHLKGKVDIIGCDMDACVLATCFNLWDSGADFRILKDYVYTTADIDEEILLKIFERNFGNL